MKNYNANDLHGKEFLSDNGFVKVVSFNSDHTFTVEKEDLDGLFTLTKEEMEKVIKEDTMQNARINFL